MAGVRRVLRFLGGAGLLVTAGVATNQVLSDGKFSWTWLYASLGMAVLSLLYSEVWSAPPPAGPEAGQETPHGRRRVYLRQLRASVRDMETVGVATQGEFVFRMRQVYVDVSVVPQVLHAATREPYLGSVPGGGSLGQRRSLASVLRDADRNEASRVLAVIGGPGSGKTTLARNTALELCEHRWWPWRRRLPVLLYLRDHATELLGDEAPALGAVAVSAGWLEGKVSARWLDRRLDRGGCVVLLDGLDEVADPAERGRVVAWVGRQIQRHPRNIYVVTSRPHGYESNPLPGAEALQVRRFTGEQIERFLRQWCFATESRARSGTGREVRAAAERNADDLLARLRERPALYDLAANPLLLTMTANVHRYRGQLPGSRAELYAEMCDVLLHRRSEARGLRDATGLTGPHKQHVVQHLALAMMKAKVRDWPARDVARAIRRPLRQVPGRVDPDVFLDEARKSGLLVEREHGVYGFAHLTLQEYLAAAELGTPRADTGVLTGNVDDPWWRETVLLWSAANDATPVISACLDSGTVPALALAFDCADQARTVDPETRDRLDALLAPHTQGQAADPARQRLLAGILATRTLRETLQLNDSTALCARPVPRDLYRMFVLEERAAGRHHPHPVDTTGDGEGVAVGMQAGDAERFVDWLNGITGDTVYRLPTPEELRDPAAAMVADLSRHTVWAHDGTHAVLPEHPEAAWPYTPAPTRLPSVATVDRTRLILSVRFLGVPAALRTRVETWTGIFTAALRVTPELGSASGVAPLSVAAALALARLRADALVRIEDFTRADNLRLAGDLDHILDSVHLLHRDLGRALHLIRTLDTDLGRETIRTRAPRLANAFDRALDIAPALGRDLDTVCEFRRSSDPALDPDLEGDLVTVLSLARDFSLCRDLDVAFTIAQDRDFCHVLDLSSDVPVHISIGRSSDLVTPSALDRAPALARYLHPGFTSDPSSGIDPGLARDLDLALDLALHLGRYSEVQALNLAVAAFRTLLATHDRTESSVLSHLDGHLAHTAAESRALFLTDQGREDPARAVGHALSLLRTADFGTPEYHRLGQTRVLLEATKELLTAIRDRRSPSDPQTLASVRTALLTAIAVLRRAGEHDRETIRNLYGAWLSLAALDHPALGTGGPRRNQILLLTRTQP